MIGSADLNGARTRTGALQKAHCFTLEYRAKLSVELVAKHENTQSTRPPFQMHVIARHATLPVEVQEMILTANPSLADRLHDSICPSRSIAVEIVSSDKNQKRDTPQHSSHMRWEGQYHPATRLPLKIIVTQQGRPSQTASKKLPNAITGNSRTLMC